MDEALKKYIDSIKEEIKRYKKKKLSTTPYLESIEKINKWLEEQKR